MNNTLVKVPSPVNELVRSYGMDAGRDATTDPHGHLAESGAEAILGYGRLRDVQIQSVL